MRVVRSRELLVSGLLMLALALVGLIAVLEKGPLEVKSAPGAYPGNTGPLGTSTLYKRLKENYTVIPVVDWNHVGSLLGSCNMSVVILIISPELPYESPDLDVIRHLKGVCRKFSILVADESGLANSVLSSLGSTIRVTGEIIQPYYLIANIETPWGWNGRIPLDKASRVEATIAHGNLKVIGYIEGLNVNIAYYENVDGVEIVVIGDGSPFLNQVLQSHISEYSLSFLRSTISHLCGDTGDCVILMEASKYTGLDPVDVLRSNDRSLLGLFNMVDLIISLLAKILHPATWLPPLLNIVDNGVKSFMELSPYFKGLMVVVLALLVALVAPRDRRVKDKPLDDVIEIDWYGFVEFKRHMISQGAKLTREDFITLYNMVNGVLKVSVGSTIEDSSLPDVLETLGLDKRRVREFREFMLRYYRRATRKTLWPPIVLWGRVVRKAMIMSESILEPLGVSLMKPSRLEAYLERGSRLSGGS